MMKKKKKKVFPAGKAGKGRSLSIVYMKELRVIEQFGLLYWVRNFTLLLEHFICNLCFNVILHDIMDDE